MTSAEAVVIDREVAVRRGAPIRQAAPGGRCSPRNACSRAVRRALGPWSGRLGNERPTRWRWLRARGVLGGVRGGRLRRSRAVRVSEPVRAVEARWAVRDARESCARRLGL
jgi:hypothetical protein